MSIYIDNFFTNVGDIVECASLVDFSVDVIDTVYSITTSGTYFVNNCILVHTYFSSIINCYKVGCSKFGVNDPKRYFSNLLSHIFYRDSK